MLDMDLNSSTVAATLQTNTGTLRTHSQSKNGAAVLTNCHPIDSPSHKLVSHTISISKDSIFTCNWNPRHTLFSGLAANPDRRETHTMHTDDPYELAFEPGEDSDYSRMSTATFTWQMSCISPHDRPAYRPRPCRWRVLSSVVIGLVSGIHILLGLTQQTMRI